MAATVIKKLYGHSGSRIYLMREHQRTFVRKIGNVERNYERLTALRASAYPVPAIYDKTGDTLDIEYIHGLDIKSYLVSGDVELLAAFLIAMLDRLSADKTVKDYTEVYRHKLAFVDAALDLPFTQAQLVARLPSRLPASTYHGDFTLENVLRSNAAFYLIDAITVEYDSYIFDVAKLRQDLQCQWFLRNSTLMLTVKLQYLQDKLLSRFTEAADDALLILMLLRVYPYTRADDQNRVFIVKAIKSLW